MCDATLETIMTKLYSDVGLAIVDAIDLAAKADRLSQADPLVQNLVALLDRHIELLRDIQKSIPTI